MVEMSRCADRDDIVHGVSGRWTWCDKLCVHLGQSSSLLDAVIPGYSRVDDGEAVSCMRCIARAPGP